MSIRSKPMIHVLFVYQSLHYSDSILHTIGENREKKETEGEVCIQGIVFPNGFRTPLIPSPFFGCK